MACQLAARGRCWSIRGAMQENFATPPEGDKSPPQLEQPLSAVVQWIRRVGVASWWPVTFFVDPWGMSPAAE